MPRDALLIAVGVLLVLAGCTGGGISQTESPNTSTPGTESPIHSPSSTVEPHIEISPCPNRSKSFTKDTVATFAMQFEQARETRLALADAPENLTELSVRTEDAKVTQTSDGWIVHFTVIGPYMRWNASDPSAPDHTDPAMWTANYLITNETIYRNQTVKPVDPRGNGTTVECPPS